MANWVFIGLRTGIRTSPYPRRADLAPGVSPGRPAPAVAYDEAMAAAAEHCPVDAINRRGSELAIDENRCVHCSRCRSGADRSGIPWESGYEWGAYTQPAAAREALDRRFGRSLHIRFIDAGACGACMSEARQLNNPYYNITRLGFFITPTPRNADVLLVAGPISDAMRTPLLKAYAALPAPKRVMAIGACAICGGVFGPSFVCAGGLRELLPVDVVVPGCPPPPLAILHGLLVLVDRKPPREPPKEGSATPSSQAPQESFP